MNQKADQAKQALICCVKQSDCRKCPFYEEHTSMCLETACKNALDYIDHLESENNKLQTENMNLQSEVRLLRGDNRNLQDLCNTEKAKVEKLHNKLVDMAKKFQASKRLNNVLAEGIERHITKNE